MPIMQLFLQTVWVINKKAPTKNAGALYLEGGIKNYFANKCTAI